MTKRHSGDMVGILMTSSIKNRGNKTMGLSLRFYFLILISSALISCALTPSTSVQLSSTVGKLADVRGTAVFSDPGFQSQITSAPSHALVIGSGAPYRLLLIDGRVAWAEDVPRTEDVRVSTASANAALTNQPLSNQGDEDFKWLEPSQIHLAYVVDAATERFSETPPHVQNQGRKIFLQDDDGYFYWPQLKIQGSDITGWASATELLFESTRVKPENVYGLVQKPFIPLVKNRNPITDNKIASFDYLDLTQTNPERHALHSRSWQAEQLLLPSAQHSTNISSIALASSGPCHMFFVAWHSEDTVQFGYCIEAKAGPAPLILSYSYSSQQESLILDILEIAGDEDRKLRVAVTNHFRGEGAIAVVTEPGSQGK